MVEVEWGTGPPPYPTPWWTSSGVWWTPVGYGGPVGYSTSTIPQWGTWWTSGVWWKWSPLGVHHTPLHWRSTIPHSTSTSGVPHSTSTIVGYSTSTIPHWVDWWTSGVPSGVGYGGGGVGYGGSGVGYHGPHGPPPPWWTPLHLHHTPLHFHHGGPHWSGILEVEWGMVEVDPTPPWWTGVGYHTPLHLEWGMVDPSGVVEVESTMESHSTSTIPHSTGPPYPTPLPPYPTPLPPYPTPLEWGPPYPTPPPPYPMVDHGLGSTSVLPPYGGLHLQWGMVEVPHSTSTIPHSTGVWWTIPQVEWGMVEVDSTMVEVEWGMVDWSGVWWTPLGWSMVDWSGVWWRWSGVWWIVGYGPLPPYGGSGLHFHHKWSGVWWTIHLHHTPLDLEWDMVEVQWGMVDSTGVWWTMEVEYGGLHLHHGPHWWTSTIWWTPPPPYPTGVGYHGGGVGYGGWWTPLHFHHMVEVEWGMVDWSGVWWKWSGVPPPYPTPLGYHGVGYGPPPPWWTPLHFHHMVDSTGVPWTPLHWSTIPQVDWGTMDHWGMVDSTSTMVEVDPTPLHHGPHWKWTGVHHGGGGPPLDWGSTMDPTPPPPYPSGAWWRWTMVEVEWDMVDWSGVWWRWTPPYPTPPYPTGLESTKWSGVWWTPPPPWWKWTPLHHMVDSTSTIPHSTGGPPYPTPP